VEVLLEKTRDRGCSVEWEKKKTGAVDGGKGEKR